MGDAVDDANRGKFFQAIGENIGRDLFPGIEHVFVLVPMHKHEVADDEESPVVAYYV